MFLEQRGERGLVAGGVAQRGGVLEGEGQRFVGVVKADQAEPSRNPPGGAQGGEGIGGPAQPDIPDHKLPGVALEPFANPQLADIEPFRFSLRAQSGMHFLGVLAGIEGFLPVRQRHQLIVVRHAGLINGEWRETHENKNRRQERWLSPAVFC